MHKYSKADCRQDREHSSLNVGLFDAMKYFAVFVLLFCVPGTHAGAAETPGQPEFVTSQACAACHEQEYAAWRDSHHGWAWRLPTQENVLGDFDDAAVGSLRNFRNEKCLIRIGSDFVVRQNV